MDKKKISELRQFYHEQLLDDCIPFWMNSDLLDKEYGGYISSVDRQGRSYNDDKSVWFAGRGLWTFSALCSRYGKRDEWVEAARLGKDFLEKHCVDTDGRMFFQTTRDGRPLRKRRYMFSESFYVVGMAEYGAAMDDEDALQKAEACFDLMLRIYNDPSADPFKITPKTYASTRNERAAAVPMVMVSSAQILRRCIPEKAAYYSEIVKQMADDIFKYHYKPDMKCSLETVLSDGGFIDNPAGRTVNPGHSMENSWFLMNEGIYSGDKEIIGKALKLLDWMLELGWDKEYGGFYYYVDISGRPCEQLEYDMKLWWVHDEALIATLMAYGLTKDEKYWQWFERIHEYAFSHFHDKEYGEWYGYLHRDGTVSHTQKGSMWKGPYHLPRALMTCEKLLSMLENDEPIKPVL